MSKSETQYHVEGLAKLIAHLAYEPENEVPYESKAMVIGSIISGMVEDEEISRIFHQTPSISREATFLELISKTVNLIGAQLRFKEALVGVLADKLNISDYELDLMVAEVMDKLTAGAPTRTYTQGELVEISLAWLSKLGPVQE